jgi:hypothetical protein
LCAGCYRIFADIASGAIDERPELATVLDQLRPGDTWLSARVHRRCVALLGDGHGWLLDDAVARRDSQSRLPSSLIDRVWRQRQASERATHLTRRFADGVPELL